MIPPMADSMTSDARDALAGAGFSRRDFLKRSGALIVTFGVAGVASDLGLARGVALAQGINGNPGTELDSWIAIAADGRVTAYTGKCDFGQGLFTAQTQLIAEELSVPIDRVKAMHVNLRFGTETTHPVGRAEIDAAREEIEASVSVMRSKLVDVDGNVAEMEHYPMVPADDRRCGWCSFRRTCGREG